MSIQSILLNLIPIEILYIIFSFLRYPSLLSLKLTCKFMFDNITNYVNTASLQDYIFALGTSSWLSPEVICLRRECCRKCDGKDRFRVLNDYIKEHNATIKYLKVSFTMVRYHMIFGREQFTTVNPIIYGALPNIKYIEAPNVNISLYKSLYSFKCYIDTEHYTGSPSINEIIIDKWYFNYNSIREDLAYMINLYKNLKKVSISVCHNMIEYVNDHITKEFLSLHIIVNSIIVVSSYKNKRKAPSLYN